MHSYTYISIAIDTEMREIMRYDWLDTYLLSKKGVTKDLQKDLLDQSYELVLNGFSKKRQREILEIGEE